MIEAFVKDARYGIRGLHNQPAFTFAAVMALALGIGATTTIFSVIQNMLAARGESRPGSHALRIAPRTR